MSIREQRKKEQASYMLNDIQRRAKEELKELQKVFDNEKKYNYFDIKTNKVFEHYHRSLNPEETASVKIRPIFKRYGDAAFYAKFNGNITFNLELDIYVNGLVYQSNDLISDDMNVIRNCALRPLADTELSSKNNIRAAIRENTAIKDANQLLKTTCEKINRYIDEKYPDEKVRFYVFEELSATTNVGIHINQDQDKNRLYEYFMDACIEAHKNTLPYSVEHVIEEAKRFGVTIKWTPEELRKYGLWKKENHRQFGPDTSFRDSIKKRALEKGYSFEKQDKKKERPKKEELIKKLKETKKESKHNYQKKVTTLPKKKENDKPKKSFKIRKPKFKKINLFGKIKDWFSELLNDIVYFFKNLNLSFTFLRLLPILIIAIVLIILAVLSRFNIIVNLYYDLIDFLQSTDGHIKFMFFTEDVFNGIRNWMSGEPIRVFLVTIPMLLITAIVFILECLLFALLIILYYILKVIIIFIFHVPMWLLPLAGCALSGFLSVKSIIDKENIITSSLLFLISIGAGVFYYIYFFSYYFG